MDVAASSKNMDDPFAGNTTEAALEKPVKRSLFKKSAYAKPKEIDDEADIFSRSKEVFAQVVIAEKERKKREIEAARLKRKNEELEREAADNTEQKRRRVSREGEDEDEDDYDADSKNEVDSRRVEDRRPSNAKSSTSSPNTKLNGSPLTRTRSLKITAISLSDDDDIFLPKTTRSKKLNFEDYSSDEEPIIQQNVVPELPVVQTIPSEEEEEEDEYASYITKARAEAMPIPYSFLAKSATANSDSASNTSETGTLNSTFRANYLSNPRRTEPIISILVTSRLEGTTPLHVKRKLSQRLKDVRMAWCDRQLINGQPIDADMKREIFLTWRGTKLFDVTTGASMGLKIYDGKLRDDGDGFTDGKILLEAWTEETYAEYQKQRDRERQRLLCEPLDDENEEEEEEIKEVTPSIRIIIKARDYEDVKVMVKPSTVIAKLIHAFMVENELESEKEVELRFDGDVLAPDTMVSDADLEDMSSIDAYVH